MKESERSPSVYTANWKEAVELKRTLSDLSRSKKTVEHSIYLDQRIIYRRFQTRMHQSQLFLSRLKGDREMEMQLRAKTSRAFNTNCGNNEEEDHKLKRLLQRSTTARPGTRTTPRPAVPQSNLEVPGNPGLYRSKSDDGLFGAGFYDADTRVGFHQSHHGSVTSLPGTRPTTASSGSHGWYIDTSRRAYEVRPHTTNNMPQKARNENGLRERAGTVANLLEDDNARRRRIMNSINTNRIKSANLPHRVSKFCESVNEMDTRTDDGFDYYNVRLQHLQKKNKKDAITIPKTPEVEYWRHVGDYRQRPITFRTVNHEGKGDLMYKRASVCKGVE